MNYVQTSEFYTSEENDLAGIGSFFKKTGSAVKKSGIVSMIPVVGSAVQGVMDQFGNGNPDMDAKCAKKPGDKQCVPYLAQKAQQQAAFAAQQAKADADAASQKDFQMKQLEMMSKLAEKSNTVSGGGIGGFDTNTLLMIGGGLVAVFFMTKK
jgi:hypothetical protein